MNTSRVLEVFCLYAGLPLSLRGPQASPVSLLSDDLGDAAEPQADPRDEVGKSKSAPVRILVVEDHPLARKTISDLLRAENGFEVIGEARNGLEGTSEAQKLQPDIVVLDVTMPILGGIEAASRIRAGAPNARIVFLSQHNSRGIADAALATGAHGYVVKASAGTDLVRAIRSAVTGEKFVSQLSSRAER